MAMGSSRKRMKKATWICAGAVVVMLAVAGLWPWQQRAVGDDATTAVARAAAGAAVAAVTGAVAEPPVPPPVSPKRTRANVRCTVRSIHALRSGHGLDRRLNYLRTQLRRPPFTGLGSFRLLATTKLDLGRDVEAHAPLPGGRELKVTFLGLARGKKGLRLHMQLSMAPKLSTRFYLTNGGTMLVAGSRHKAGTLVVGITCRRR